MKLLRALAGKDWGWSKKLLRTTYVASVRSVLLYGAAAWTPWLSRAQWSKLEKGAAGGGKGNDRDDEKFAGGGSAGGGGTERVGGGGEGKVES